MIAYIIDIVSNILEYLYKKMIFYIIKMIYLNIFLNFNIYIEYIMNYD